MNIKKISKIIILSMTILIINILIIFALRVDVNKEENIILSYKVKSNKEETQQIYYSTENQYGEDQSIRQEYKDVNNFQFMEYIIPKNMNFIRFDISMSEGTTIINDIKLKYSYKEESLSNLVLSPRNHTNDINNIEQKGNNIVISSVGQDPFIVLDISNIININQIDLGLSYAFKIVICLIFDILCIITLRLRNKYVIFKELLQNKNLIWNLTKNDFKTKYAASYLGIFWAFVQPVVTILIYWFVFEVGFKAAPASDMPFVLWLIPGIIPWFFFAEAIMNATNSLLEYSYLVKKVVFKISILPIIKVLSSLFVHLFFVGLAFIVFILYGKLPTIYSIQIIYYILCTVVLTLAISYFTSSVVVFFRDLGQIVNVVLQIGMWLTPIMWNQDMISIKYRWILKLNPVYYIVEGYRDCFINKIWFWDKMLLTIYFWIVTILFSYIGIMIFNKLKKHFADVL